MTDGKKDIHIGVSPKAGGEISVTLTETKGERTPRVIAFEITSAQARGFGILLIENAFMADRMVPSDLPAAPEETPED